ncbi:MAG: hypothetical protein RL173_1105 [Fibrobacterota bacterium]|jgi:hypothetical protein
MDHVDRPNILRVTNSGERPQCHSRRWLSDSTALPLDTLLLQRNAPAPRFQHRWRTLPSSACDLARACADGHRRPLLAAGGMSRRECIRLEALVRREAPSEYGGEEALARRAAGICCSGVAGESRTGGETWSRDSRQKAGEGVPTPTFAGSSLLTLRALSNFGRSQKRGGEPLLLTSTPPGGRMRGSRP